MKNVAIVMLTVVGFAAIVAITLMGAWKHDEAAAVPECSVDMPAEGIQSEYGAPDDGVSPLLDNPVTLTRSFRILCSSVDAGTTVTDVLVPVDGGVAGYPIPASSVYIAPTASSSVLVRVGGADVTSATGFQVGATGRDGPGFSLDARGPIRCKSEGAAQACDVIVGVK